MKMKISRREFNKTIAAGTLGLLAGCRLKLIVTHISLTVPDLQYFYHYGPGREIKKKRWHV